MTWSISRVRKMTVKVKTETPSHDPAEPYFPGDDQGRPDSVPNFVQDDLRLTDKEKTLAKKQLEQKWKLVPSFLKVRGLGWGGLATISSWFTPKFYKYQDIDTCISLHNAIASFCYHRSHRFMLKNCLSFWPQLYSISCVDFWQVCNSASTRSRMLPLRFQSSLPSN